MADDIALLVLWTVLAVVFGMFILWKYVRGPSKQRTTTSQVLQDVQSARLKYFASGSSADRTLVDKNVPGDLAEDTSGDEKLADRSALKSVSKQVESTVRYTRTIKAPRNEVGSETGSGTFDPKTSCPVSHPIKTLEETFLWRPGFDYFNVASVPLSERFRKLEKTPRTLVCHDMKGGYIEDRFVQGYGSSDCYVIYHWQFIDIFVYFSHHFITIPPPCWTNAAHTHGVPVLGTLITESDDGIRRCEQFLQSRESWEKLANQLVDIAEYYKFDGWLINIENHIQPVQMKNLEKFVKYLTRVVHARVEGSLVIWYDSVTYKGDLAWQNELNANNRIFFDACDGIFLNYGWSEAHLMRSAGAAGRERLQDVYVGVDVFGRGCFGGGGYNCNKAFQVIREEKLSAALFAPGWVMETQGVENFIANQDKFWNLLSPYCTLHAPVKTIPFVTSMCRGYGNNACLDGMVVYSKPWTNLSGQQCQPTYSNMFFNLSTKGELTIGSVDYTMEEAYNGGGCQVIKGHVSPSQESSKAVARLFKTDLSISNPLLVSFTFKLQPADCVEVCLQLRINKLPTYILLCPASLHSQDSTNDSELSKKLVKRYGIPQSEKVTSSVFTSPIGQEHYALFAPLTGTFHEMVQQAHSLNSSTETTWCSRHYLIADKQFIGCTLEEIRVVCAALPGKRVWNQATCNTKSIESLWSVNINTCFPPVERPTEEFQLHVGEIKILDPSVLKKPLSSVRNIRITNVEWKRTEQGYLLSLTLMWDCPIVGELVEEAAYYNVVRVTNDGKDIAFLGRAFVEAYRVCQIPVLSDWFNVEFIIQLASDKKSKTPKSKLINICSIPGKKVNDRKQGGITVRHLAKLRL